MNKESAEKIKKIDRIVNDIPNDPLGKYNALTVRNHKKPAKGKKK